MISEQVQGEFAVPQIDPPELLTQLGKWAVEEQKKHFRQGEGTVPDVLTERTGTLKRSINYFLSPLAVDIRPDYALPYAVIQQTGGETHPKVTERSKSFFWFMFKLTGDEKWKWMALQKVGDVMTVRLRPRPYMYFTKDDIDYIRKQAVGWIVKAFTGKKEVI